MDPEHDACSTLLAHATPMIFRIFFGLDLIRIQEKKYCRVISGCYITEVFFPRSIVSRETHHLHRRTTWSYTEYRKGFVLWNKTVVHLPFYTIECDEILRKNCKN